MIKKRAMAESRWTELVTDKKRLDTGQAVLQPNWPYWVQPRYYNVKCTTSSYGCEQHLVTLCGQTKTKGAG